MLLNSRAAIIQLQANTDTANATVPSIVLLEEGNQRETPSFLPTIDAWKKG
jgi:hypothetical protein